MGKLITVTTDGDFRHVRKVLHRVIRSVNDTTVRQLLTEAGEQGVIALRNATPRDTGRTANAWFYKVEKNKDGSWSVIFCNDRTSDTNQYVYIAHLLQYGHFVRKGPRTRSETTGRLTRGHRVWVPGIDYVNPALEPVFRQLADKAWEQVGQAFEITHPNGDVIELDDQ